MTRLTMLRTRVIRVVRPAAPRVRRRLTDTTRAAFAPNHDLSSGDTERLLGGSEVGTEGGRERGREGERERGGEGEMEGEGGRERQREPPGRGQRGAPCLP